MRAGVRTSSVRVTELYRTSSATRRTSSAGMLRFQNVQGLCCTAAFAREWQNMSTVRTYSTSVPRPGHFLVAISRQFLEWGPHCPLQPSSALAGLAAWPHHAWPSAARARHARHGTASSMILARRLDGDCRHDELRRFKSLVRATAAGHYLHRSLSIVCAFLSIIGNSPNPIGLPCVKTVNKVRCV